MKCLARFNGRFTVPVAAGPCSRACLFHPVQPCPASWEALDVDFGGVSFPGPAPLTQHCHDAALARHTGLSHGSLWGGGENGCVSSSVPSPSRGVWGLHPCWRAGKWLPHVHSPCVLREGGHRRHELESYGCHAQHTVLFWVLHWCCTAEVLPLVLMSVGMTVVALWLCWLGHFGTTTLFCVFYYWVSFLCAFEGVLRGRQMKA